jgi:subtilisin
MIRRLGLLLTMAVAMLFACAAVVLAQATTPPAPLQRAEKGRIPDNYIIVLKDDAGRDAERNAGQGHEPVASDMAREHDLKVTDTYQSVLKGFVAKIPAQRLSAVRSDPRVEFVTEDRVVRASAQRMPTGVNRIEADKSSTRAGNGSGAVNADIAILDTGIYEHRDLRVSGGYNCMGSDSQAWSDLNGHGTHVAGSAAAKDNRSGVVGVAPGARLWAIKVLDKNGSGTWSSVICGIDQVTTRANTIEVANLSLSGFVGPGADDGNCGNTNSDALHLAICNSVNAGVTYVVAAGNDGSNASNNAPAAYDEVITVSALADYNGQPSGGAPNTCFQDPAVDDDFASFSNFGSDVDLGAPGVCIRSTWISGGYRTISGTSMASPHVAGTVALYRINHPSDPPAQVRTAMTSSANTEAKGAGHTDLSGNHPEPVILAKNH